MKKETKDKNKKTKEIEELKALLQRVQADFENYRKQVEEQNKKIEKLTKHKIFLDLLPVIDSFELALKNIKNNKEFIKGIELIYSQLHSFLKKHNVKPIKAQKYNPELHEVLLCEEGEEENLILEELQKGYMLDDIVLRHAKVKISKKNEGKIEKTKNNKTNSS